MAEGAKFQNRIEEFISAQVTGRGLDNRTEKAYRQDLEHFYTWMEENQVSECVSESEEKWETRLESYLEYLSGERRLRPSTITRKYKVFTYYLAYLAGQGIVPACRPLKLAVPEAPKPLGSHEQETGIRIPSNSGAMSKQEVDALFRAANREYENLDSDFRRRVCLRDLVMLELLFFHRVEVSELLRLEASDYDEKTGILTLGRKRGKEIPVYVFSKALRGQLEQWLLERAHFQQGNEYDHVLFLSKLGRPLSMKMVINVVDKYRRLAGIEKEITPKDLKKSMERYARELMMERCG